MKLVPNMVSALLVGIEKRQLNFAQVIEFIGQHYHFTPQKFVNGYVHNEAGENDGSAKVFGFAKLHDLNQLDTLKLFAEHYRSVLATPQGTDHANIRNFQRFGWQAFLVEHNPLSAKVASKTTA